MKITLKRKVEVKSAVVYLKIQTEVRREDIKNYLESNGFSNPIIEMRVKKYLRGTGIYNNHGQLTDKGQKARTTGLVEETEEGKYQIWYTQDDSLFGSRIFYFRRIKPDAHKDNPQLEPLNLNFDREKTFVSLPIWGKYGKEPVNFSIVEAVGSYCGETKKSIIIDCDWSWNNIKNSEFSFKGEFEWQDYNEKEKKHGVEHDSIDSGKAVDLKIDLKPHIPAIIPNWNEKTERCKLKLENIDTPDVLQYFEYSGFRERKGFYSCEFEKLPVEPYNGEEAREWRNRLLKVELERGYVHPDDYASDVIAINQKEGFSSYADIIIDDIPEINQFIGEELEAGKRSDRGVAYWHLAAPLDLYPGIPQSLRIDSFSLKAGDRVSFRDIAKKFNSGFCAEKVFYFDSYVVNYYQQRAVAALLKSLDVPDMCIITDKNIQGFSDHLLKNEAQISVEDIGGIYSNRRDVPHDRYLVFKKSGDLQVWTGTNSIDYIRFDRNVSDIQPETPGNVIKSVTFTEVNSDVLEAPLKNFILKG
jgi:hypothetical protein